MAPTLPLRSDISANDYQSQALETAVYPGQGSDQGINYCTLGINGEAGEIAEKVKKHFRDDAEGKPMSEERKQAIVKELGDVVWYVAMMALELRVPLSEVMRGNLAKLAERKQNDKLHGDGDER